MENKRIPNFEILRVLLMFLIVSFHFVVHGLCHSSMQIYKLNDPIILFNHLFIELVVAITSVAVNCYILISGYFLVALPFKFSRITKVWIQTFFYSVVICTILYFTVSGVVQKKNLLGAFTPIRSGTYWFVTKYFGMLLLSPFLSRAATSISRKEFHLLLLVLSFMNITFVFKFPYGDVYGGSTSLLWFIFLFFVAGYVRLYDPFHNVKFGQLFFLFTTILWLVFIVKSFVTIFIFNRVFYYSDCSYNGLAFFSSLSLFLWFRKHSFTKNVFVSFLIKIAPYTLGVYLIHDNIYFRSVLWVKIMKPIKYIDSWELVPIMFSTCTFIFVFCLFLEYARNKIFSLLKIDKLINSLFMRIKILCQKIYSKYDDM